MLVGNFRRSWQCLHLQYEDFCSFSGAPPPFLTPPLDSATHKTVHNKIERKIHTHTRRNRKTPSKSYVQRRQVTLLQVRDVTYCQGGCRLVDQGRSQGVVRGGKEPMAGWNSLGLTSVYWRTACNGNLAFTPSYRTPSLLFKGYWRNI